MSKVLLILSLGISYMIMGCDEGTDDTTSALISNIYVAPWASNCAGSGSDYRKSTFTVNADSSGTRKTDYFSDSSCAVAEYSENVTFTIVFGSEVTITGNTAIEINSTITGFTITPQSSTKLSDLNTNCSSIATWTLNTATDALANSECGLSGATAWFDILRIDSSPNPDVLYYGAACSDASDPPCATSVLRPTTFDTTMLLKQ